MFHPFTQNKALLTVSSANLNDPKTLQMIKNICSTFRIQPMKIEINQVGL